MSGRYSNSPRAEIEARVTKQALDALLAQHRREQAKPVEILQNMRIRKSDQARGILCGEVELGGCFVHVYGRVGSFTTFVLNDSVRSRRIGRVLGRI